jgi:hypothetical protein
MTDAIAAGITGAAEAAGVIQWSIPAKARVDSKPKRTSCLPRANARRIYSAVAQRLPLTLLWQIVRDGITFGIPESANR